MAHQHHVFGSTRWLQVEVGVPPTAIPQSPLLLEAVDDVCTEAVYLLAWSILLQRYRWQDDVCFVWRDERSPTLHYWQHERVKPGETVLANLLDASEQYLASDTSNSDGVVAETAVHLQSHGAPAALDLLGEYELVLSVTESELCVRASTQYSLFQIQGIAQSLESIISSLTNNYDDQVGTIYAFTARDNALVSQWNATSSVAADCCLHDILDRQAARTPSAEAVCAWDGSRSYADLALESSRLACHLSEHGGIAAEQLIGFAFEKRLCAITAMIAILRTGAVYTPLDPQHPPGKLKEAVDDLQIAIIVCSPSAAEQLSLCTSAKLIVVDDEIVAASCTSPTLPLRDVVRPENAAALLHTSGTTGTQCHLVIDLRRLTIAGKPKGVVLEHNALATSCRDLSANLRMSAGARLFQFASFTYDLSVSDVFCALSGGCCICVPSDSDRLNDISRAISSLRVNHATLTPAVASQLDPGDVPSLQTLLLGGEPLPSSLITRWADRLTLMNIYGITETTAWTTATQPVSAGAISNNIGRAVCGRTWLADLDDFNRLAPVGGVGEIVIEGPTLARHYLNNPEATAKAFATVPHYLEPERTIRIYRSGDIGRYNDDGSILCLGRRDAQVKISGQRIELSGIESRMMDYLPDNSDAAAVVIQPTGRDPVLTGYLALDQRQIWTENDVANVKVQLNQQLRQNLPAHTVPRLLISISKLPKARTGKLDRAFLARKAREHITTTRDDLKSINSPVAEMTLTEHRLRDLWVSTSDIDASVLGPQANFLHFGDSVAAIRLSKMARNDGLSLHVADIMKHPVLSDMAAFCDHIATTAATKAEPESHPSTAFSLAPKDLNLDEIAAACQMATEDIEDVLPCTPLQEGLMTLSLKHPGAYIERKTRQLLPKVDVSVFKSAWDTVVRTNPILRTRIVAIDSRFVQVVCRQSTAWDDYESSGDLSRDTDRGMDLGAPLTRYTLSTIERRPVFAWTWHHAVFDGNSQDVITGQLEHIYAGGIVVSPPPFANFVSFVQQLDLGACAAYWREQLQGAQSAHFPVNIAARRREIAESVCQGEISFVRPRDTTATSAVLIRAAWALLAAKHSLSDDIVIGTTLSGRSAPVDGVDRMTGPCIATVPVRVRVPAAMTVAEFLNQMQTQANDMIPHEQFGLQNIRKLSEDADLACRFDNLLVINPEAAGSSDNLFVADDEGVEELADMQRTFALSLQVFLTATGARIVALFDGELLTRWYVLTLIRQMEYLLQQLCSYPDRTLAELDYFCAADASVLQSWNGAPIAYADRCVHSIFADRVAEAPDACAVISGEGSLTYGRLHDASTQLAHHLVELGVCPGVIVPILFERSIWIEVCLLAVVKAGGAFLLLDPDHPDARLRSFAAIATAQTIVCSPLLANRAQTLAERVCIVTSDFLQQLPLTSGDPCPTVSPDDTLYMMMTSGTTGTPKGSLLDHQAYASSARAMQKAMSLSRSTRALYFASNNFDASVEQLLATLLYGGTVVVPNDYERNSDLSSVVTRLEVNFLRLTPSYARTLYPQSLPTVRKVNLIGEPLIQQDLDMWREVQLFEGWGPSECTNSSAILDISAAGITHWPLRQVGLRATNSVHMYIVDPEDASRLAPIGAIGEIVIDGANVAQGYLNNPERTALAFVERPPWVTGSSRPPGKRMYCTGDLGRHAEDGSIIFVGRKDTTQVKIRGQRLELGEVENSLRKCLSADAQVVADVLDMHDAQQRILVTFVCCAGSQMDHKQSPDPYAVADGSSPTSSPIDRTMIRAGKWTSLVQQAEAELARMVPNYMIPVVWVPVTFIPSSQSGKTDRRSLKSHIDAFTLDELTGWSSSRTHIRPPNTAAERAMRSTWAAMLHREEHGIGMDDSWFRLGGDSISAMKLTTIMAKRGLKLTIRDVFQYPRLEDMAAACSQQTSHRESPEEQSTHVAPFSLISPSTDLSGLKAEVAALCAIDVNDVGDILPCTPLQQGLMAISVKTPGREMAQFTFPLHPGVDLALMKAAWDAAAATAAVLRTRIVETAESTLQVVANEKMSWTETEDVEAYLKQDRNTYMTPGSRLCRLALVTDRSTSAHQVCLSIHHAMYDGWTLRLIAKLVDDCYRGLTTSRYVPFNVFISHLQIGRDTEALRSYWATRLADASPGVFPRPPTESHTPHADCAMEIDVPLDERNASSDFTLAAAIRGAWAIVLGAYTGQDDVVFGSTVHGRNVAMPGIENLIGPTFTTVPVRIRIDGGSTIAQFLQAVQRDAIESSEFEHLGLQNIRDINEHTWKACGFQNVLVIQPERSSSDPAGVLGERLDRDDPSDLNNYGLMLDVRPSKHKLTISASHDSSIIDSAQLRRVLDQTTHVLGQLLSAQQHDRRLSSIEIISPQDYDTIREWNKSPPETLHCCIHDIIAERALNTPDAEALCSYEGSMTYREVDQLSSRVAAHLVAEGVQIGQIVPLCFDKSVWTVIALLAVLKSGAAFILLDPAHQPTERMRLLIEAVRGSLLICGPKYEQLFRESASTVVVLARDDLDKLPETYLRRQEGIKPEDTLCILFTSGSTGTPKGIVISHEGFATSFDAFGSALRIGHETRLLQFSAYAFDACVGDMLAPLMHGGCVCIPNEYERMNDLVGAINRLGANWALLTPSFARSLEPCQIPGLRTVLLGGEMILPSDEAHWSDRTLLTGYGPAESSLCMSAEIGDQAGRHAPNLGWPVGCRTWVADVDDHTKLAPIGMCGQLIVEGPVNAAGGYLNDPAKTAASFGLDHCWLPELRSSVRQRFFKTGDLVRYASDGSLIFIGRADTLIKLRGQRVEVGEVEFHVNEALKHWVVEDTELDAAITTASTVGKTALTLVVAHEPWCQRTLEANQSLNEFFSHVQAYLAEKLPSYMVPSLVLPIDKLPFTSSKKIDRKALTQLTAALSEETLASYTRSSQEKVPPATEMERRMCELFAEVLRCQSNTLSADDSLIRLGGDSISAMRMVALARKEDLALTVADIFNNGTPRKLAGLLEQRTTMHTKDQNPEPFSILGDSKCSVLLDAAQFKYGIAREAIQDIYPCSSLQVGLMSTSSIRKHAYVANHAFEIPAHINLDKFCASWMKLAQCNDILRTRIIEIENSFYQIVIDEEPAVPVIVAKPDLVSPVDMDLGLPLNIYRVFIDPLTAQRYFLWYSHHSTYDGWSLRLLLDQVQSIYYDGVPPSLPAYSRFINHIEKNDHRESASFWKDACDGTEIYTFPAIRGSHQPSGTATLRTDVQLQRRKDEGITMSTLIRAAWAIVLKSWCPASCTPSIGAVLAGRTQPVEGIDNIAGPTLTTIPIIIPVHNIEPITSFLARVQQQSIDMLPHEQYGLQRIAALSDSCKKSTEFQTLLAIQPQETHNVSSDQLMRLLPSGEQDEAFYTHALTVQSLLHDGGFEIKMNYDRAVLDDTDAGYMVEQFICAIKQLALSKDGALVGNVTLLNQVHAAQVQNWSASSADHEADHEETTVQRITHHAGVQPARLAVQSWDGELTYGQLSGYSTMIADHLRALGVGSGSIVAVCSEKSLWAVVSQLAIVAAGGAFVSLDPSYPQARLDRILSQIGPSPILVSASTAKLFDAGDRKTVLIDQGFVETLSTTTRTSIERRQPFVTDLMYVIFTSGTTGEPKGVMISHGAFDHSSRRFSSTLNMNENSRVLQFASYVFDASVMEVFSTLSVGGTVCIPQEADRTGDLAGMINSLQTNWALLTPSVLRLMNPKSVPCLQTLVVGAEALGEDVVRTWEGYLDLYQAYGPAEASIITNTIKIQSSEFDPRIIGPPVNCRAFIADQHDHDILVGLGCVGELIISGPTLANGYLKDQEKTDAAFVHTPRWARSMMAENEQAGRFYKTGDLVKWTKDGALCFMGRKDQQIKYNGQRVELAEIEHAISSLLRGNATAAACMVDGLTHGPPQRIVAAIAFANASFTGESALMEQLSALKTSLRKALPSHMVPSVFLPLDKIPLNYAGKVDRRQIAMEVKSLSEEALSKYSLSSRGNTEPKTPSEKILQRLWEDTLGLGHGSARTEDDFFDFGDSISAIRLAAAAREAGFKLSAADVFRQRTFGAIAELLNPVSRVETAIGASHGKLGLSESVQQKLHEDHSIEAGDVESVYPCFETQAYLMKEALLQPGANIMQTVYRLGEDTNLDTLMQAWKVVTACTPILRTRIIEDDAGELLQVLLESDDPDWQHPSDLAQYLELDAAQHFGLGQALVRYAHAEDQTGTYVVWAISHALYDGWSIPLLLSGVEEAYLALNAGTTPSMSSVPLEAFAHHLQATEEESSRWIEEFDGVKATPFPIAHPLDLPRATEYLERTVPLRNTAGGMKQKLSADLIHCAWAIVLAANADRDDVVYGTFTAGRNAALSGIETAIAPLLHKVPLRVRVDGDISVQHLVDSVRQQHMSMASRERMMGMHRIAALADSCAQACQFRTMLIVHPAETSGSFESRIDVRKVQVRGHHPHELVVEAVLGGGDEVKLQASWDERAMSRSQVKAVMGQLVQVCVALRSGRENERLVRELELF